jgi:hypothetical protein
MGEDEKGRHGGRCGNFLASEERPNHGGDGKATGDVRFFDSVSPPVPFLFPIYIGELKVVPLRWPHQVCCSLFSSLDFPVVYAFLFRSARCRRCSISAADKANTPGRASLQRTTAPLPLGVTTPRRKACRTQDQLLHQLKKGIISDQFHASKVAVPAQCMCIRCVQCNP